MASSRDGNPAQQESSPKKRKKTNLLSRLRSRKKKASANPVEDGNPAQQESSPKKRKRTKLLRRLRSSKKKASANPVEDGNPAQQESSPKKRKKTNLLSCLRSRKKEASANPVEEVCAYILTTGTSAATEKFEKALMVEMNTRKLSLKSITDDMTGYPPEAPLIVVCNNYSRLDTDVAACLGKVNSEKLGRLILIILHVSRPSRLSKTVVPLDQTIHSEEYPAYSKVIDMAFDTEQGIYSCEMNSDAFKELDTSFRVIQKQK